MGQTRVTLIFSPGRTCSKSPQINCDDYKFLGIELNSQFEYHNLQTFIYVYLLTSQSLSLEATEMQQSEDVIVNCKISAGGFGTLAMVKSANVKIYFFV